VPALTAGLWRWCYYSCNCFSRLACLISDTLTSTNTPTPALTNTKLTFDLLREYITSELHTDALDWITISHTPESPSFFLPIVTFSVTCLGSHRGCLLSACLANSWVLISVVALRGNLNIITTTTKTTIRLALKTSSNNERPLALTRSRSVVPAWKSSNARLLQPSLKRRALPNRETGKANRTTDQLRMPHPMEDHHPATRLHSSNPSNSK